MTSRRQFLRGHFSRRQLPLRPPWALAEESFLLACTRCGDCVRACPQGILVEDAGYPRVEFGKGECTFCGDCVTSCKTGALRKVEGQLPWRLQPVIGSTCLATKGVVCRTCGDVCPVAAIRFRPQLGGSALPEVEPSRCTGCGGCVAPCPARAIELRTV
ncbi:MAG: ferredoxin-type protein NapF [Gammaproteobacteria bacterium]|nr:ferredoxin-type protein NapF [Gammaproteobacteria bacterium]MBU1645136.1 ferredoxin-type protein NapF [Gammaproteobacteria bacterium]MBU1973373.1 ferredoxin-type protein NapF [Gammaproteobacteria bacterium]